MASRGSKGRQAVRVVGRQQLSTGDGTWDEWHVAFDDGHSGWLAEAQGGFWLMLPVEAPQAPGVERARSPASGSTSAATAASRSSRSRQATYVSAEGELPFAARPGAVFRYADLSSADGGLATLDYGTSAVLDAFYVGRRVELAELGIEGLDGVEGPQGGREGDRR